MKDPKLTDERLSALLEGRLHGPEREELLAHLAASDDDFEVFTDTAEILMALEAEGAGAATPAQPVDALEPGEALELEPEPPETAVIPLRRPRRAVPVRWLALAASIAGVALVSALALRTRGSVAETPLQLAARVDAPDTGLVEWAKDRPWSMARGGNTDAIRQARAAQAGALLVDLSVAVQTGDSLATANLAEQLRARFDSLAGPDTPLPQLRDRAGAASASLQPLVDAAHERLADRLPRAWLDLGAWTEAARLAADGRDRAFFDAQDTQDMLRRAERLTRDDAGAQNAIVQIHTALPENVPPQWKPLAQHLRTLLREIASES